ncbi:MAG: hypothetical protein RR584_12925 [Comamonas sp.]
MNGLIGLLVGEADCSMPAHTKRVTAGYDPAKPRLLKERAGGYVVIFIAVSAYE